MAWKLEIATVNKTSSIESTRTTQIERLLNERARMRFSTVPGYVPARFATVKAYAQDGVTPIFGGVITGRGLADFGIATVNPYYTDAECGDYFTYFDWAYVSLTYTSPVTLETVMNDFVAALPVTYGITVDAAQVTGPTLAPFTWDRKRGSDAVRELSGRTGYVSTISPLKAWKMFIPGTDPAPFTITDGAPHCRSFRWCDSDQTPANSVTGIFGPNGEWESTQYWIADGVATSWVSDLPARLAPAQLLEVNDGVTPYLALVGAFGSGGVAFEWDDATHTLHVGTAPVPAAGVRLSFGPTTAFPSNTGYLAQGPFVITEASGATPVIEVQYRDESILMYGQGLEDVLGRLAQLNQQPREIEVESDEAGWATVAPGQALTVALTARVTGTFVITNTTITLQTDLFWRYGFRAIESATYQGSYLDQWRALTGGSSSGVASASGGGGSASVTVLSSPVYMGGATATAVTNPTTKKLIPNAAEYFAPATFTGRLRVRIRARDAAVGVKAIISDGTTDIATAVVTSQTFTSVNVIVPIVSGHTYRVHLQNTATGDGFCEYAYLEAA